MDMESQIAPPAQQPDAQEFRIQETHHYKFGLVTQRCRKDLVYVGVVLVERRRWNKDQMSGNLIAEQRRKQRLRESGIQNIGKLLRLSETRRQNHRRLGVILDLLPHGRDG